MDSFGVPANGMMRTFAAQEPQSSIISGRSSGYPQAIRQVANRNTETNEEDYLSAAKGIIFATLISIPMWIGILWRIAF